jgi:hypothetical protein
MLKFQQFHEYALMGTEDADTDALMAIRKGIEIGDEEFWDQFLRLSEAIPGKLSKLLGIKESSVRRWNINVNNALEQVKNVDDSEAALRKPKLMRGRGNAELDNPTGGGIHSTDAANGMNPPDFRTGVGA